jgi:uncharacterized protein (TIGR02284 family)
MDKTVADHLKALHTGAIDARKGYMEALHDADAKGMTPLFQDMIAMHSQNATELSVALTNLGERPDASGSFMGTIHRAVMGIRSLFGGLDESVLPGLVDGETRNLSYYDETLQLPNLPPMTRTLIDKQRNRLAAAIASMRSREMAHIA